ncbi:hypothetical protein Dsin_021814 [Dipteronia sinensis]|uniref:Uncharacterized protein n=1 Tax=Dipteronia sinensis TaxID=43782 RepID=A0AAE0DZG6_9ROSI|nr:hypothetical protein Dsin_021814 [Dipteronia sinensis]
MDPRRLFSPSHRSCSNHPNPSWQQRDHALDLPIPGHSGDTIFIKAEREDEVPTIIQIPKQLPRDQLFELMPLSWITNYEKAFQNTVPVIAPDTTNTRQLDGTFKTVYKPLTNVSTSSSDLASTAPPTAPPDSPIFQSLMIRPLTSEEDILIHCFEADGSAIYTDKINGHFIWDVDPSISDEDFADYGSSSVYSSYQAVSTESSSWPQVPFQILLEKFSKSIDVIAYFDTSSHTTMMNPNILPPDSWKPHTRYFKAVDGKIFTTNLISKTKIGINSSGIRALMSDRSAKFEPWECKTSLAPLNSLWVDPRI